MTERKRSGQKETGRRGRQIRTGRGQIRTGRDRPVKEGKAKTGKKEKTRMELVRMIRNRPRQDRQSRTGRDRERASTQEVHKKWNPRAGTDQDKEGTRRDRKRTRRERKEQLLDRPGNKPGSAAAWREKIRFTYVLRGHPCSDKVRDKVPLNWSPYLYCLMTACQIKPIRGGRCGGEWGVWTQQSNSSCRHTAAMCTVCSIEWPWGQAFSAVWSSGLFFPPPACCRPNGPSLTACL